MSVLKENGVTDTRIPKPTIFNALDISINIFEAVFFPPCEKHDCNRSMDFDIKEKKFEKPKSDVGVLVM